MPLFIPDLMLDGILDLTAEELKKRGIRGILLDVDNTLTSHGNPEPLEGVVEWSRAMRRAGIGIMIVSNNTSTRVAAFANKFDLPFIAWGMKPLPFGFIRARRCLGLKRREVMAVGDQVYTDVLGAHLAGVQAVLLTPVHPETSRSFRVRRHFEKGVIRRYHRKNRREDKK